ncbi:hypothetical protein BASA81_017923 [Batrachochytrium salamandrivorans]|nr:hypothetical protein BASA81_017923 [Batrachochytrium salamandrivorans]
MLSGGASFEAIKAAASASLAGASGSQSTSNSIPGNSTTNGSDNSMGNGFGVSMGAAANRLGSYVRLDSQTWQSVKTESQRRLEALRPWTEFFDRSRMTKPPALLIVLQLAVFPEQLYSGGAAGYCLFSNHAAVAAGLCGIPRCRVQMDLISAYKRANTHWWP